MIRRPSYSGPGSQGATRRSVCSQLVLIAPPLRTRYTLTGYEMYNFVFFFHVRSLVRANFNARLISLVAGALCTLLNLWQTFCYFRLAQARPPTNARRVLQISINGKRSARTMLRAKSSLVRWLAGWVDTTATTTTKNLRRNEASGRMPLASAIKIAHAHTQLRAKAMLACSRECVSILVWQACVCGWVCGRLDARAQLPHKSAEWFNVYTLYSSMECANDQVKEKPFVRVGV